MKIRNIGTKVVGVNNKVMMPDDEMEFSDAVVNTPGFKALMNAGILKILEESNPVAEEKPVEKPKAKKKAEPKKEEPVEEPKAEEAVVAEEAKEEVAEEKPAPKKKSTTRKKKAE